MGLKYYYNLIRGKTDAINPAKLSLRNILAVIQAFFRRLQGYNLPAHLLEQSIWRRLQVMEKSPECWAKGHCIHCGCEILGKTIEDRGCIEDPKCYPDMMNKKKWRIYKKVNNVKLFD